MKTAFNKQQATSETVLWSVKGSRTALASLNKQRLDICFILLLALVSLNKQRLDICFILLLALVSLNKQRLHICFIAVH